MEGNITSFDKKDHKEALLLLRQNYLDDMLELPLSAPAFDEPAALWAAKYFCTAAQLMVLRDEGEAPSSLSKSHRVRNLIEMKHVVFTQQR